MKDIYHYANAPVRTITAKAHPLLNTIADMLQNQDYYGTEIRHEGDPIVQQVKDVVGFMLKQFEPFSARQYTKLRESGEPRGKAVQGFFGIVPAPKEILETKAERRMGEIIRGQLPRGARTKQEANRSRLVAEITTKVRAGRDVTKELQNPILRPRDKARIMNDARVPATVARFKRMSADSAVEVYIMGTEEERKDWGPILSSKLQTAKERGNVTGEEYTALTEALTKAGVDVEKLPSPSNGGGRLRSRPSRPGRPWR
jgi:hypothetical protein